MSRQLIAFLIFAAYVGLNLARMAANPYPDAANQDYAINSAVIGLAPAALLWLLGRRFDGNSDRGFPFALLCLASSHLLGWQLGLIIAGFLAVRLVGGTSRVPSRIYRNALTAVGTLSFLVAGLA